MVGVGHTDVFRHGGGVGGQETRFFDLLQGTTAYGVEEGKLYLADGTGAKQLVFRPSAPFALPY